MGVLGDKGSWCFCSGGDARSERVKGSIYTAKGPSIASICCKNGSKFGTGFMIHRGLLLTTHANIPSVAHAENGCQVKLGFGRIQARLVPNRFFITSSILDLTIVGLDSDSTNLTYIKTGFNPTLDLGHTAFLLGHTTPQNHLTIGEGKIVISTDNLIKLSTDSLSFSPGSAGFDMHGNLSFMLCDPMKLATSPMCRTGSRTGTVPACSYSLSRKDLPMQFGVPVPVILDWLRQHWNGSLDEVTKPRLVQNDRVAGTGESNSCNPNPNPNPNPRVQLLDINFPPRLVPPQTRSIFLPLPLKQMLSEGSNSNCYNNDNNNNNYNNCDNNDDNDDYVNMMNVGPSRVRVVLSPSRTESNCCSEVQSSSSPVHLQYYDDGFTTGDDEITMYSAETMESRNIPSPKRKTQNPCFDNNYDFRVNVGRSQSSGSLGVNGNNKGVLLTKQHSLGPVRRANSQSGPQRSQDFLSPTVSSAMKKRNSVEKEKQPVVVRAKQGPSQGPAKWVF